LHGVALTCNRPGFFQERLSDVCNGRGEQLCLLFLGGTKNKVHEAFGHSRCHLSHVNRLLALNVLLNEVIDLAVQNSSPTRSRPAAQSHVCSPCLFPLRSPLNSRLTRHSRLTYRTHGTRLQLA